jgi:prepilin-type processing-associated H-X9-DG protein
MYANESRGNQFPGFSQFLAEFPHGTGAADVAANFIFEFAPNVTQIYPEYLNDPNILVCPSNPVQPEDLESGCIAYNDTVFMDPPTNLIPGCMENMDGSYQYYNWMIDRAEDDDPLLTLAMIQEQWSRIGTDFGAEYSLVPASAQGICVYFEFFEEAFDGLTVGDFARFSDAGNKDYTLEDARCLEDPFNPGVGLGNGGSNQVFHWREGIERFLITDINNPGASAKAQSEMAILWDQLATTPADFNHLPGGANVAYLDGHVSFLKYPSKFPVNRSFATYLGGLIAAIDYE